MASVAHPRFQHCPDQSLFGVLFSVTISYKTIEAYNNAQPSNASMSDPAYFT